METCNVSIHHMTPVHDKDPQIETLQISFISDI